MILSLSCTRILHFLYLLSSIKTIILAYGPKFAFARLSESHVCKKDLFTPSFGSFGAPSLCFQLCHVQSHILSKSWLGLSLLMECVGKFRRYPCGLALKDLAIAIKPIAYRKCRRALLRVSEVGLM
jgi:hypothetical protein